jgi:lysozyme
VIPRESSAPGATGTPFYYSKHLNGVDISGWNKGIDVTALDADFVIIKATEGVHGTIYNPSYATWANQALSQGKLVGFYHYANGGNAVAEADSFYEAIKGFRGRVIACLDWEGQGNPTFNTGRDVEWCKTFLDRLRSRFGGTPFLYTSKSYCNAYDWTSVSNTYPLWGAQYASNNPVYGYQSNPWQSSSKWGSWGKYPTIFQYSGNGQLARDGGNPGSLDLNLFYGARSDWNRYL